ncbi:hypothetical protein, partial [Xenophilus sp.]|uniref:hypothetical protein n=1 Tax=Xenophilus sp. TaxID=1873499 RepID=UPI0037DC5390
SGFIFHLNKVSSKPAAAQEALKKPPLDGHLVRVAAHGIAKKLLNDDHAVSAADMAKISDFVATTPLYEGKRLYESNGTDDRPFYKSMLR